MENSSLDNCASVEAALDEAGFKVDEIEKLVNKTVITVSPKKQGDAPQAISEEK